jgi:hypothetical protein
MKKQWKAEKSKKVKEEAVNASPLPVKILATSFEYLDCMTYVEHVLALASAQSFSSSPYKDFFLNRLIDIMFDSSGKPLMNHMRNHFVSMWARNNVKKGYLKDIAKAHKDCKIRKIVLNKVKENHTFYVEDAFMHFKEPENIYYFQVSTLLNDSSILKSGDILALVCAKEGLDVVHMGFFIEKTDMKTGFKRKIFRHASYSDNRIIDSDFASYMTKRKNILGLMVLRPLLKAPVPYSYKIKDKSKVFISDSKVSNSGK